MFLRNAWYVAALDIELKDGLLPVKILNERIVLYRKTDGRSGCARRRLRAPQIAVVHGAHQRRQRRMCLPRHDI